MARNSTSSTKSQSASSKSRAASPAEKQAKKNGRVSQVEQVDEDRLFNARVRRDITGVVFAVLSAVIFFMVVFPSDAVVTSFVSLALRLVLGVGAYLLPLLLLIVGVCFLVRFETQRVPLRVTVGLVVIFVAILVLFALFTPLSDELGTDTLFVVSELASRGGYVGAGIAWVGLTLFGKLVSCVIVIGMVLCGLAIIGVSISRLIERVQDARAQKASEESDKDVFQAPAFARIKKAPVAHKVPVIPVVDSSLDNEATHVLPKVKKDSEKQTTRSRKTPASESLKTKKIEPSQLEAAMGPAVLTRKLGSKRKGDAEKAATMTSTKKTSCAAALVETRPEDDFVLPPANLLNVSELSDKDKISEAELKETALCLRETLEDFNILAQVVGWVAGPTVTLFKVDLPSGVRVSRITALEDDIALALAAPGVRIFAPIPGTNHVGIEVPNSVRANVLLGDVIKDAPAGPLQMVIGKDVEGRSIVSNLASMPHLLIGGTTGSGKSVSINAMIMSILMRATPSEVRFIMIDPKRVEFTPYNGIPHLYVPVVTEPREAASALSWGVAEMERRLKVFSKVGARNISQYNTKVQTNQLEDESAEELPYIVIIIDELADLMMNVGKEVEFSISRIAQLARAAGIHLIVATQRPSTNVVTGLIKANITNRIAFNVASSIDSRVILDTPGADNLIGLGDMLLSKPELSKPQRIQGCYVSEDEITAVVSMLKEQGEPEYHSEILQTNLITLGASQPDGSGGSSLDDDPLIWEAADIVVSGGLGSTSSIQRRLKVGYSRAGRIMDMLEEKGVVGPPNGSKPREVLVDAMELETLKAFELNDALGGKE